MVSTEDYFQKHIKKILPAQTFKHSERRYKRYTFVPKVSILLL